MLSNKEIASVLKSYAKLMELHGENDFKVRSYNNAAFRIERQPGPVAELDDDEIISIQGIGKNTVARIRSIINTGTFDEIGELLDVTPEGVVEMMDIKGVGPKKISVLWKELGIETPGELLYACNENRLVGLKGFGEKTQKAIMQAIEFKLANASYFHYAFADMAFQELKELAGPAHFGTSILVCGPFLRKCELIRSVDLVTSLEMNEVRELFDHDELEPDSTESEICSYRYKDGLPVRIFTVNKEQLISQQFLLTGSEGHIAELRSKGDLDKALLDAHSDEDIYAALDLQYIEPELREGMGEVDEAAEKRIPQLLSYTDLRGSLHNHSTYSDGHDTLREMAEYCKGMGLEYLGICDHSKSAFYANGLSEDRIREQHREIDELNTQLAPFHIFKGIESDILSDGSLDYSDDVLEGFDFIVASIHSNLRMDIDKATSRIIKAVSNPYTTILGHPTGRLLLAREGYPVDHRKVIDACAENNVVIELNAHPYRLDLDWRWIRYATDKGVKISVNPDAHSTGGFHDMYYGVCAGRKGKLTAADTLNCMPLSEIRAFFMNRKSVKIPD